MRLTIVPLTWRQACLFNDMVHRHHKAPRGCKWALGVVDETGNQTVVFGRRGSRPFKTDEMAMFYRHAANFDADGNATFTGNLYEVADVVTRNGDLLTRAGGSLGEPVAFKSPDPEETAPVKVASRERLVRRGQ